jgi:hypothetical protein
LILRGIAQGVPTAKLAREVGVSRQHLLRLRHAIQARVLAAADRSPLPDDQAEADEMYQNEGENCRVKANFAACQPRPPKDNETALWYRPGSASAALRPEVQARAHPRKALSVG